MLPLSILGPTTYGAVNPGIGNTAFALGPLADNCDMMITNVTNQWCYVRLGTVSQVGDVTAYVIVNGTERFLKVPRGATHLHIFFQTAVTNGGNVFFTPVKVEV